MVQRPLKAVILTALSVEFRAVRQFLTDSHQVRHTLGNVYEQGRFTASGREWQIGLVETGTGDAKSSSQTERAISFFQPDVVLFVGVAGGLKDVSIGDVVASTKVYGYESGKAEEEFKPRPEIGLSGFRFIEEAKAEVRSNSPAWLSCLSDCPEPSPQLKVGPIAVGEKVIASKKSSVYQFLLHNYSDALAVEMEGYGFLESVQSREPPLPAIVVRGISDLIDDKNDETQQEAEDIRQQKAAHHASALAFQLLASYNPDQGITASVSRQLNVESGFWDGLFSNFQEPDLAFLKSALEDVLRTSDRDYTLGQIDRLSALRTALVMLDDQDLAVAWVGHLLQTSQSSPNAEDVFTNTPNLQRWYDENQPPEPASQPEVSASPGYLLITLEPVVPSGVVDEGHEADNVSVMVELHVPGEEPRTDFLPRDTQCSIERVCEVLADVVPRAGRVRAVEVFLPWQHFGEPVHNWKIRSNRRGRRKELWRIPRNTVVRSLDRLQDPDWSQEWLEDLQVKLQQLQTLTQICAEQICCAECYTEDLLDGPLQQKLIFKLWGTLPEDQEALGRLLFEVIESKVPIWLWTYQAPANTTDFSRRVDELLIPENIRESAMLTQLILEQRSDLKELGLLFDGHTRFPCLPTLAVDPSNPSGGLFSPAA